MTNQSLVPQTPPPVIAAKILSLVLDGLDSAHSRRAYERAIMDFLTWHEKQGRPKLTKALIQHYVATLRDDLSPANLNQRLSAIRKLVAEAAANELLDRDTAAAIKEIRGVRQAGRRTGFWLSKEEAQAMLRSPNTETLKGKRDRALLAVLIGTGLRRLEAASLTFGHLAQLEGRWVILNLVGKRGKLRSVPMPAWAKHAIDLWAEAADLNEGHVFRPVNKGDKLVVRSNLTQNKITPEAIRNIVVAYALQLSLSRVVPHDLRRTFAKLAHKGGSGLDQIQLSLGHESIQTTERYLGIEQDLTDAPCDHLGLRM